MVVNCTTQSTQDLIWSIKLPEGSIFIQFTSDVTMEILNGQGFYEQPKEELGNETVIQLLVNNNTLNKNGTIIRCLDIGRLTAIAETTLIEDGKTTIVNFQMLCI